MLIVPGQKNESNKNAIQNLYILQNQGDKIKD